MVYWKDLYKELAEKIQSGLPEIRWIDLWHEQVQFLTDELPFPAPAVFIGFQTLDIQDKGIKEQDCNTQVDFYVFFECFSDTYNGSYNQDSALEFLDSLTRLHVLFHGKSGTNYNTMRRCDLKQEESGGSGNLYRISFNCMVTDESSLVLSEEVAVNEIKIEKGNISKPSIIDDNPLFSV